MSSTANGWPRAVVTVDAAGRAHVNLSGVVTSFEEGDAEAVRTSVIRFITQRALVLGREIPASITEPDDHWEIIIHPDGMVTENPLAPQNPAQSDEVPPPQAIQPAYAAPPEQAVQAVQAPVGPPAQPAAPVTTGYGYVPEAGHGDPPVPAPTADPWGQALPAAPGLAPPSMPSLPPSIPPSIPPAHPQAEWPAAPDSPQTHQAPPDGPPGGQPPHGTAGAVEAPPATTEPGLPQEPAAPQGPGLPAAPGLHRAEAFPSPAAHGPGAAEYQGGPAHPSSPDQVDGPGSRRVSADSAHAADDADAVPELPTFDFPGPAPLSPPPVPAPASMESPAPAGSPALPSPAEAAGPLWSEEPAAPAQPWAPTVSAEPTEFSVPSVPSEPTWPTGPAEASAPVESSESTESAGPTEAAGPVARPEPSASLPAAPFEASAINEPAPAQSATAPMGAVEATAAPTAEGGTAQTAAPTTSTMPTTPTASPPPVGEADQGPGPSHHGSDPVSWQEGVPATPQTEPVPGAARPRPTGPEPGPLAEDRAPARTGLRGAVNRMGLRLRPSRSEQQERRDIAAVSTHWSGSRTVAVVNGKGGSMKTPTAVLLSAVFARHGGTGVVAFDNNPARGTLGWRTEPGPHERTVADLLASSDRLLSPEAGPVEISAFTHHQNDGFDVLRSHPETLDEDRPTTAEAFTRAHEVLSWYYRLVIIDSGNDEGSPAWRAMIARADAIVVPTITRPEHAESARLLLTELSRCDAHGADLASRALVVVSQSSAAEPRPDELVSRFRQVARDAVAIPYDPMMAGRPLHLGSLAPATRRAWLHAAARLATGLH